MKVGSRDISLGLPVESAWAALVSGDRRDWYYRLTPEGEFAEGNHIRWRDAGGKVLEESDVFKVQAPALLVLKTRFLFAPTFAAEEPHLGTWTIEEEPWGCRVSFTWRSGDVVAVLFEAERDLAGAFQPRPKACCGVFAWPWTPRSRPP